MPSSKPSVLYWDIETLPMLAYVFDIGKQYVNPDRIVEGEQVKIACICARDLNTREKFEFRIDLKTQCDKQLLRDFTKLANKYDISIGHNLNKFDIGHLRTRIAMHELDDCLWAEGLTHDTLTQYRRSFNFPSNRLDYIARLLEVGQKNPMGMADWIDVKNGSKEALDKMVKYCHNDVTIGIKVYNRLKPYIKITARESNIERLDSTKSLTNCEHCDSTDFKKNGTYTHKDKVVQKYLCRSCWKTFPTSKSRDISEDVMEILDNSSERAILRKYNLEDIDDIIHCIEEYESWAS